MLPRLSSCSVILSGVHVAHGLPLTVHSNCSERLWLRARTFLVVLKNRLGWPGEPNWRRTLPPLPLNYASVIAAKTRVQCCLCREVDEIWQYRTGGNLTAFEKDHGTAEEGLQKQGSCSQAYGFTTITMYSWWQSSEIGCAYRIWNLAALAKGGHCKRVASFYKGVTLTRRTPPC
jgi:hypothetical protein